MDFIAGLASSGDSLFAKGFGFFAVVLASVNIFGGFLSYSKNVGDV